MDSTDQTRPDTTLVAHLLDDDPWSENSVDVMSLDPDLSMGAAYTLQFAQMSRRAEMGDRIVGYKAAATSLGAQTILAEMPVPSVGTLLASCLAEDGAEFAIRPGHTYVEVEIAAVLASSLAGPQVNRLDAARAVGWLCPAIEIAAWAPRVAAGERSPQHAIATHKTNGAVIVGSPRTFESVPDLRLEGAVLEVDGKIIGSGTGVEAMGNPLEVVAAIARLLSHHGLGLEPGMVVMTGSLLKPFVLPIGGRNACASFTHLGRVSVQFSDQRIGSENAE